MELLGVKENANISEGNRNPILKRKQAIKLKRPFKRPSKCLKWKTGEQKQFILQTVYPNGHVKIRHIKPVVPKMIFAKMHFQN